MFDSVKRRRGYPVKGLEGVFVRLLDRGEKARLPTIPPGIKDALILGFILVQEDGSQCCQQNVGETDIDYAKRCNDAFAKLNELDERLILKSFHHLQEHGEEADVQAIAKN